MIAINGKKVAIKTIEKRAVLLAEEGVQTVADAQAVLGRDKAVWDGSCAVLRRLGKRRHPTEDEQALYRTWYADWGFPQEDILAACAETTKGEPTFAYLNGILSRLHGSKTSARVADALQQEQEQAAPLRALLSVMKLQGVTVNPGTLAVYEDMRTLYPDHIILMAGQECARRGASFEDVMQTLRNWKRNGLATAQDVQAYMRRVDDQNDFLRMLYEVMGLTIKPNAPDRRLAALWLEEFAFDPAFVTQCAVWAIGKDKPMAYLAALMEAFHKKNIHTIEAAQQERESFQQKQPAAPAAPARTPKTVEQQQYTQREYAHSEDAVDELMKKWQEENGNA
jgi:DNA replication protein DnaD